MNQREIAQNLIIISLGGSLIVPDQINVAFMKEFKEVIEEELKQGKYFIIITGGGKLSRRYVEAADKITAIDNEEKDWLGIHATRMNAHFVKTIFKKWAHPRINKNPRTRADLWQHFRQGEKIMVAAGWRPGWSTDYVAVILAERFQAKKMVNLSNITYVYDKDPNKFQDAQPIEKINWQEFRQLVGNRWDPGMNTPFDPIAAQLAEKNQMEVAIIGGQDLSNLKNYFQQSQFKGTIIN